MKSRVIAPVIAALAVAALAGCGSSDDSATTATSVVTVTRTAGKPSETVDPSIGAEPPVVTETVTSTADAPTDGGSARATAPAPTVSATNAFVGHYQAHDADTDITRDGSGWMDLGDGAANYERWRTAWSPSGASITIRLVRRDELRGAGMSGSVGQGTTFTATFASGSQGITILHMTKGGQKYVDWCDVNRFGGAYECGA